MQSNKAMIFAIQAHESVNQRYNGSPYSVHLNMVIDVAREYISDIVPEQCHDDVLAACWLHDTIEDCRLTYNDIKKVFGENVAEMVYAVTNDKGKNRKERAGDSYYRGIRNTSWATFVKMCDRLANIRYSKESKSRMLDVYMEEHDHLLASLIGKQSSFKKMQFSKMIKEMESILTNIGND